MKNRLLCMCLSMLFPFWTLIAQPVTIKSPDQFLPYRLGERFTPHHLLVDYFEYVDKASDYVQLVNYGQSYELRPLMAAIISTPENIKRLEEIRTNHLRQTGILPGTPINDAIAIVYLSYSVHGNEAACAETAMAVLYDLVRGDATYSSWLKNTVVIIDPTVNPDGFDRYAQWSNRVSHKPYNVSTGTREHNEPWPGGRFNHYYFDLNRDWVWQSQQESRQRLAFFHQWMPHVHADVHEMSYESPYYFAPAAQPYHPNISEWQTTFQKVIGKNHAKHFDEEGWRYFTRERFDLFYPSYGDTYSTFAGAIGMTYEQGGSGYANRAIVMNNGDTLTLADRIAHHRKSSLSTIEVCSKHAKELVDEYASFYKQSMTDAPGDIQYYIIKRDYFPDRVEALLELLDRNKIVYQEVAGSVSGIQGFNYLTAREEVFAALDGDIVIPSNQPRAVLLHVLFETNAQLTDSLTYDITSWCLPMAYGLKVFATKEVVASRTHIKDTITFASDTKPFAYAMPWGSVKASHALGMLLQKGIVARYAPAPFTIDDKNYDTGTVLFMKGDNRKEKQFETLIKSVAEQENVSIEPLRTGFVEKGNDLGSDQYVLIRQPKVLAFAGEGISPPGIGEIWHFFEEDIMYPIDLVELKAIHDIAIDHYNVILLTDGYYMLDDNVVKKLSDWVSAGGRLVMIGSANQKLEGKNGFNIKSSVVAEEELVDPDDLVHIPEAYSSDNRNGLSDAMPGAVFQTTIDKAHPLTFGLGDAYWTLKTSVSNYAWLPDDGNAIYLDDSPSYLGFAGYKALERTKNTLIAGQQEMGAGSVVFLVDNPLFRSFWNSGKVLFSNALFFQK